jgi:hypothetical protein
MGLGLVTLVGTARADQIITAASFSGIIGQAAGLQYFDPTLGTLDSVNVQISGVLQATVQGSGPCTELGCTVAPYSVQISQNFSSEIAGQFFSFGTPAQLLVQGVGSVENFTPVAAAFSYSFSFTSFSDLSGSAPANASGVLVPPLFVTGTRAGFLTPAFPLNDVIDVSTNLISLGGASSVIGLESGGSIFVTYNYTPTQPVSGVSESSAWVSLGGFLFLLFPSVRRSSLLRTS